MVKHVVKCEKWACSPPKAGKNKPIMIITKTRDFARICEKIKEKRGFVMNPRFGLNNTPYIEQPTIVLEVHFKNKFRTLGVISKSKVFRVDIALLRINAKGLMI